MRFSRFLLAALFACATPVFAQATAPELPRVTYAPPTPAVSRILSVNAGDNLQAVLDSAKGGDVLLLACGATFSGHFTLPAKTGAGWVVVGASCAEQLPAAGTRLTPAVAAKLNLPKIVSQNYEAAISTLPGAHHYRLTGIEITVAPTIPYNYGLVLLGGGNCGDEHQCTLADVPHDLVLDHVYIHGTDTVSLKRCVALNSASTAIVDSYLSACHAEGQDAQAAGGWNGPGPFTIVNNYLEGSGENVMFGGADPAIPNLVPSDITITGNLIAKPARWLGERWSIKNLLELKNAQRVLIEGNVFDGSWQNAQGGFALVLWSVNQSGTAPWSVTQDVTVRRNVIRNIGAGFQLTASADTPAIPARRFAITDNLVTGMDAPGFDGYGRAFQGGGALSDVLIARNTILGATLSGMSMGPPGTATHRLEVTDNITSGGAYGITGDNTGLGSAALKVYAPDGLFQRNALIIRPDYVSSFPSGNQYPASADSVGFVNLTDGDFHLSTSSRYRGLGAPVDSVLAATAGAITGTTKPAPTPTPTPALTLAQLRAAITALDKATGPTGRENVATKAALVPVDTYLKALLTTITAGAQP